MKTYAGIVVLIAVLGIGSYAILSRGERGDMSAHAFRTAGDGEKVSVNSFKELLGTGSYECHIDSTAGETSSVGVMYISDNQFRGDFQSSIPHMNITVDTYTLWDGEWVYAWSSLSNEGTKVRAVMDTFNNDAETFISQDSAVTYECVRGDVDERMFAIPAHIVFEEINI